ncbi:hypothetical protein [Rhabdothermincola sp.]|uniref:hypothetical protein n=1 Tax=Rhabdothermincola sp. TaxID=2820405 RepID=UPI002FE1B2AF
MGSNFSFDKRALEKLANDTMRDVARKAQPHFDRLYREHSGKPVAEVEPHVREVFRGLGWKADSPSEIRGYAEAVSRGERIVLKPERLRL